MQAPRHKRSELVIRSGHRHKQRELGPHRRQAARSCLECETVSAIWFLIGSFSCIQLGCGGPQVSSSIRLRGAVPHRRGLWLARDSPEGFESGSAVPTSVVCRPGSSRAAANSGGTASLRPSARPAQRHHCARGSIGCHPCARHSRHALRRRADAVIGWSAARDAFGGAGRSTWNLGRPIAQGPEGAADLGSTGRTTRSEQVMSCSVLRQLSRRVRCALTPWLAKAGMLDRKGRFEAPICPCRIASITRQLPLLNDE